MFRVCLTPERIDNAHSFLTQTASTPWYEQNEGWKTGKKSSVKTLTEKIATPPINLPFPLMNAHFELIKTGNRYAIAMILGALTDKAFVNLTKPPRVLFDNRTSPFFIPTCYDGGGYFLETRTSSVCLGAITAYECLREISFGMGGARNLAYKDEKEFRARIAQLSDLTNQFIEAVRENYERQRNVPILFPKITVQIS